MSIEVRKLVKRFGAVTALQSVDLTVPAGELVALLGPSGSGKTSLLRIIAGLDFADSGQIIFHGDDATDRSRRERGIGFVFQHYALFKHMTVFENIAFGLRVRPKQTRPSEAQITSKVHELLELIQLDTLAQRYPAQLSGGQRQRVALARALAVEPKILLLDEPFGALDAKVRKELRQWLRRLHDDLHVTSLFVTHDQEEALEVADRIVVMNQGRIEQVGTPAEVYHRPATAFVYHFLGDVNLFHCRVENGQAWLGDIPLPLQGGVNSAAGSAIGYVRPHLLEIDRNANGQSHVQAVVQHINPVGPIVKVELKSVDGSFIEVGLTQERYKELNLKLQENVFVMPKELQVFGDYI